MSGVKKTVRESDYDRPNPSFNGLSEMKQGLIGRYKCQKKARNLDLAFKGEEMRRKFLVCK
jgi:hypothetical protein